MYPAESDEVVLILDIKELLLTERLTRVRPSLLLRDNDVGDMQLVP